MSIIAVWNDKGIYLINLLQFMVDNLFLNGMRPVRCVGNLWKSFIAGWVAAPDVLPYWDAEILFSASRQWDPSVSGNKSSRRAQFLNEPITTRVVQSKAEINSVTSYTSTVEDFW